MTSRRVALITGITGQDGSYLAELLLDKGYEVHGLVRPTSVERNQRIDHLDAHLRGDLTLHPGDVTDGSSSIRLMLAIQPDEVYHLAAQSHVAVSFQAPEHTAEVDALGTLRLLEAVRHAAPKARFFQASTSELFGLAAEVPQRETTPFRPRSPYAIAKLFAYWSVVNYRDAYGLHASNGILFNHESPRRSAAFVTRKVARAAVRIRRGSQRELALGNLSAKRDWGWAPEYVDGIWRILQHDQPIDVILATGEVHTVRQLVELAFEEVGLPLRWQGLGPDEVGLSTADGRVLVRVDPTYFRPTEADLLQGDASRAAELIGWNPQVRFAELVSRLVESEAKAPQA